MAVSVERILVLITLYLLKQTAKCSANDILGCGGFVRSHVELDFSEIQIGLYTKGGSLKEKTECAPTNGYYFLPLYEKGEYVLKVHPPAGYSFEPSEVAITVDGVTDRCSTGQDINFAFNGFGINGRVITLGQKQGPSGITVQLISENGETRNTVTIVGGEFHFTAVIPGKYTVKASHPRWKLEPSQMEVQMKEGKMAVPVGVVLAVKGYDVKGSIESFGSSMEGVYVLLYSKEENPKYRVEGCNTALLQGVPDSPICHSTTDLSGEFSFGLVPAGEYRLMALSTTPGQNTVSYNIKPDALPFSVKHDSLYIKNAFEITGFTVVGSVVAAPGKGLPGTRVLLDGKPIGNSDATGKFTLAGLQPGVYTVSFQHEQCELEDVQVSVSATGLRAGAGVAGRAARWRVCGDVTAAPPAPRARRVALRGDRVGPYSNVQVDVGDGGKWCTFLPPGVYTARVEVSEQEQREGLQFYPLSQKVSVGHGPVEGVTFSQLKGELLGRVECGAEGAGAEACENLPVTLRTLAPEGGYVGQPITTLAYKGEYKFSEVLPGSVELSVPTERLCWAAPRQRVQVTQARVQVPPFRLRGHALRVHCTHAVQVEYTSGTSAGVLEIPRGASVQCVTSPGVYTFTPKGCHKFQPPQVTVDVAATAKEPTTLYLVAVAHAAVVTVMSPDSVTDLVLAIDKDGKGGEKVGPLTSTEDGGMYVFQHTLYLADGEVSVVSASSATLLFEPAGPQQVVGTDSCQPTALTLRAVRGLTLAGAIVPAVSGVTVTLSSEEGEVSRLESADGTYRFGPLAGGRAYRVAAHKDSYAFSAPDAAGNIAARRLAEIQVHLRDATTGAPLQGALVSVSGGSYRRNVASGAEGSGGEAGAPLRFPSLSPAQYYIKPNMKEYRFSPPHTILDVDEGRTHTLTLSGTRVAWSCVGALVSLGGAGWSGARLAAMPRPLPDAHAPCVPEEATTDANGAFRIRGLLPNCEYSISLKESSTPELAGLRIVKAPSTLKVVEDKDITGVVVIATQPTHLTDGAVHVYTSNIEHYKTLRLTLSPENSPDSPVYSTKLDAAGFTQQMNPGVMHVLPRLAADNKSYTVQLHSAPPRAAPRPAPLAHHFLSDGHYKHISFVYAPEVKSSEQELRQSSFLLIPLLGILSFLYMQRDRLLAMWPRVRTPRPVRSAPRLPAEVLDKASIDQILNQVNAAGKKPTKKKALLT